MPTISTSPADDGHARVARHALAALGGAGLAAGWLLPTAVAQAGLAPVVVAAGIALAVGAPLAAAHAAAPGRLEGWPGELARTAAVVTVAAALGAALEGRVPTLLRLPIVLLAWPLAWAASTRLPARPSPAIRRLPAAILGLFALATLIAVGVTGFTGPTGMPWSTLSPDWSVPSAWLPGAVTVGLAGAFALQPDGPGPLGRGLARRPWSAVGGAVLLLALGGLAWAAAAERTGEAPSVSWWIPLAAVPALLAVLGPGGRDTPRPRQDAVLGFVLTGWFAAPGAAAVGPWFATGLPLAVAAVGASMSWSDPALETRLGGAALAILGASAAVLGWPGLPEGALDGALAALPAVALAWVVGVRTLTAEAS